MNVVENEIELWYYTYDRVFVGAAGTWSPCDLTNSNNVIFPAEMIEVLAVSPANWDGSKPCSAAYGPELDVIAYHSQPATGSAAWGSTPVSISESSNAAGVVGGIAALVRSKYPSLTAPAVMSRIWSTSAGACGMPSAWHRIVNAEAAVGGLCLVDGLISGPSSISFDGPEPGVEYGNYSVTVTGGNGPIEYSWREGTETGPTHTHTFLDPGWDYTAHVDVIIRDAGTTNPALTFRKLVYVYSASGSGTPCTPEPPAIACDP